MHFFEFKPKLNELNMAPGRLKKFAQQAGGKFTAGFEAECIFRDMGGGGDGELERDMDVNDDLRQHIDWDDIEEFFQLGHDDRTLNNVITLAKMKDEFSEFWSERESDWVQENLEEKKEELSQEYNDGRDEEDWMEPDDFEEEAVEALQQDYSDTDTGPSIHDWLRHELGLRDWEDLCDHFGFDWPFYREISEEGGYNKDSAEEISAWLEAATDIPSVVNDGYHGRRAEGMFAIEPDASITPDDSDDMGCEIVSPPLPLMQTLDILHKTLQMINQNDGYTNESTGLHINLSIEGMELDYVKLVLFLGDERVLQQFGRDSNTYTQAAIKKVQNQILSRTHSELSLFSASIIDYLENMNLKAASNAIMLANDGKYVSVNFHKNENYVEFRSMGGEYSYKWSEIQDNVLRFAKALEVASNPQAYTKEYAAKLFKILMAATSKTGGPLDATLRDAVTGFALLQSGQIDKSQLKTILQLRANQRKHQAGPAYDEKKIKPKLPK